MFRNKWQNRITDVTFMDSEFSNAQYYEATSHVHVAPSRSGITVDVSIFHISYSGKKHILR